MATSTELTGIKKAGDSSTEGLLTSGDLEAGMDQPEKEYGKKGMISRMIAQFPSCLTPLMSVVYNYGSLGTIQNPDAVVMGDGIQIDADQYLRSYPIVLSVHPLSRPF